MVPLADEVILCSPCSNPPSFHKPDSPFDAGESSSSYSTSFNSRKRAANRKPSNDETVKPTKKSRLSFFDRVQKSARELPLKKSDTTTTLSAIKTTEKPPSKQVQYMMHINDSLQNSKELRCLKH